MKLEHAAGDCQSCHPNHHQEQVDLLEGKGSHAAPGDGGQAGAGSQLDGRRPHRLPHLPQDAGDFLDGHRTGARLDGHVRDVPRRGHREAIRGLSRQPAGGPARAPGHAGQGGNRGQAAGRPSRQADRGDRRPASRSGPADQGQRHPQHALCHEGRAGGDPAAGRRLPPVEGRGAQGLAPRGRARRSPPPRTWMPRRARKIRSKRGGHSAISFVPASILGLWFSSGPAIGLLRRATGTGREIASCVSLRPE